jgi:hypothetical protein
MGARSVRVLWRQRFGMSGYESPSIGTFGLVKGFGTGQRHTEHSALAAYARFWVSTSKWWSTSLLLAKRVGTRRHESSEGTVGAAAHQVGDPSSQRGQRYQSRLSTPGRQTTARLP